MSFNFRISNFGISTTIHCCNRFLIITTNTIVYKVSISNINTGSSVNSTTRIIGKITIIYSRNTITSNRKSVVTTASYKITVCNMGVSITGNSTTFILSEVTIVYCSNTTTINIASTILSCCITIEITIIQISSTITIDSASFTFIISEIRTNDC